MPEEDKEKEEFLTPEEIAKTEKEIKEESEAIENNLIKPPYKEETIEIIKGKRPRKVRVRIIPIEWEGKQEEVIIKKLSFGERAQYGEKFVNIHIRGEFQDVSVSLAQMQIQAILTATYKAPFPITEDYVTHELDCEVGEKIHKAIDAFNKLTPSVKKKSDGPLSTELKT